MKKKQRINAEPGWIEAFNEGYKHFWAKRGIEIPTGPDMHKLFQNPAKLKKKVDIDVKQE